MNHDCLARKALKHILFFFHLRHSLLLESWLMSSCTWRGTLARPASGCSSSPPPPSPPCSPAHATSDRALTSSVHKFTPVCSDRAQLCSLTTSKRFSVLSVPIFWPGFIVVLFLMIKITLMVMVKSEWNWMQKNHEGPHGDGEHTMMTVMSKMANVEWWSWW